MVNDIAQIDIKPPRLPKQGFVAGGAAAVAACGGVVLRIRLRFHNHAPQQLPSGLALHKQAAVELRGNQLGRASEEGVGEVLGGCGRSWWLWGWVDNWMPRRGEACRARETMLKIRNI